jgi:hypothetical protein
MKNDSDQSDWRFDFVYRQTYRLLLTSIVTGCPPKQSLTAWPKLPTRQKSRFHRYKAWKKMAQASVALGFGSEQSFVIVLQVI